MMMVTAFEIASAVIQTILLLIEQFNNLDIVASLLAWLIYSLVLSVCLSLALHRLN